MFSSSTEQPPSPRAAFSRLPRPRLLQAVRGGSRQILTREILAGVTLAALMIPLNIGYAQVAGLPPIVGLYAAILPSIVFALAANTRHVVASPDASAGAIIAAVVGTLALAGSERYLQLVFALALLCGGFFLLFWLFRLGFLANYLSRAILIGYVTGLGLDVLLSQTRKILGVSVDTEGFFHTLAAVVQAIPETHIWSLVLGLCTIIAIRLLRWKAPQLPGALIALAVATLAVALFNLEAHGVRVLGAVPSGLPRLAMPQVTLGDYFTLIPGAIALCAVTLAEAPLLARQYANKFSEKVDVDQDFFAFGLANLVSGFSGGLTVGSSGSRTAAMESVGSRSQIPSLVAGVVVTLVLLFFTGPLALLPIAALAGIVADAVVGLVDVGEFRRLWRVRRSEFWIALVACVAVLALGVLEGIVIAFLLTTIELVRRAARPEAAILVEMPNGASYEFSADPAVSETHPGFTIYFFGAPLYFANANLLNEQIGRIIEAAAASGRPLRWLVLDASAITDIDVSGAEALGLVVRDLGKQGITFAISRPLPALSGLLERYDLLDRIGRAHLYQTNRDAYAACVHTAEASAQSSLALSSGPRPAATNGAVTTENETTHERCT